LETQLALFRLFAKGIVSHKDHQPAVGSQFGEYGAGKKRQVRISLRL